MEYVTKPRFVEAAEFADLRAAMDFLKPGEFSMVTNEPSVLLVHKVASDTARVGDYLVRTEDGVEAWGAEAFNEEFMTVESATTKNAAFTLHESESGFLVECENCGPLAAVGGMDEVPKIAMQHVTEGCHG